MNTTSSGAVGFAPVGTFVKDLAQELGKSASTVAAYIKKHLPAALVKRKNVNNRLANFALEEAVEAARAHYSPSADSSLQQELERLRAENFRLKELLTGDGNCSVEQAEAKVDKTTERLRVLSEKGDQLYEELSEMLPFAFGIVEQQMQQQWREANDTRRKIRPEPRGSVGQLVSFERRLQTDIPSGKETTDNLC